MPTTLTTNRAQAVIARCLKLASFTEASGSTRRTFLSPPMHDCHREISKWIEVLGAQVRIDAAGNLRALYPAAQADGLRLMIGSHLDTVPNAGAYDGILGIVLAVALLEDLQGRRLPFAIETIAFSEEEGVRFDTPFIGSRALVGRVDDQLLNIHDGQGITVRQAIKNFGLNPESIPQAKLGNDALGYLEFHIEQGPVLESLNQPLAAVEAIAGQSRLEFTFLGRANHAGTTPMHLRRDAIAGAAEWIGAVERVARNVPDLVATVGKIEARPGTANVIAAEARLTLDVRHRIDDVRARALDNLTRQAREIAARRNLTVHEKVLSSHPAVVMDTFLTAEIEQAIVKTGCNPHRMVSGAGHDAMIMAEKVPSAMIFLRTPGGISHDPAESVVVEDVEKAIDCGLHLLDQLASSPELHKRMNSA
ncbi:MAG: allantoate amidohydrolase [Candidatus Sulfotelmatobacter sp.]